MAISNLNNTKEFRRKQIASLQDEFSTFSWGGLNMFDKFGAFIINDKKGSLKFYNGPGFTNEYSKPQFSQNSGDLLGVNFNRSTIAFTVGVYWFTVEEYRQMMSLLSPLKTDMLSFGFNSKFGYMVKLSKIGDSTKYPIGRNEDGDTTYYTELQLTFEVQGDQVARGLHPYELVGGSKEYWFKIDNTDFAPSDLPTPVVFDIPLIFNSIDDNSVTLEAKYTTKTTKGEDVTETIELFNVHFSKALIPQKDSDGFVDTNLNIKYNSATGMLFLKYADSSEKILSLVTTSDTGERIINTFNAVKFLIPGCLDYNDFDIKNLTFVIETENLKVKTGEKNKSLVTCECFPRTNIL